MGWGRESNEAANERRCREFLKPVEEGLREHVDDALTLRYGRLHPDLVLGLIAERKDGAGHVMVVPVAFVTRDGSTSSQGGVCPKPGPGVECQYSISVHPGVAWREGEPARAVPWDSVDAIRAPTSEEAIDRILTWAFPDPGSSVGPTREDEHERLKGIAAARRQRFTPEQQFESARLRGEGRIAQSWQAVGLACEFDPAQPGTFGPLAAGMQSLARRAFSDDLLQLQPDWLVWNFPAQDDGRLPLGEQVILAVYETNHPLDKDHEPCLVARSPERRRDGASLRISLEPLIPGNHPHRWDRARRLWDARHTTPTAPAWGLNGIPVTVLAEALKGPSPGMAELEARCAQGGTPADRAMLAMLLQEEGRLAEALALYEIEIGPELEKLIADEKLYVFSQPESWSTAVQTLLRRMALWHLEPTYRFLCTLKRSKRNQQFRIAALPNQPQQRKLSLMLAGPAEGGRVRLDLEATAGNSYVPVEAWQRPIELDFLRYGVPEGLLPDVS